MFERYTETARRAVFFARYEASMLGASAIEVEHLLLGVLREDRGLAWRLLPKIRLEQIRQQINAAKPPGKSTSTSVDMPCSEECKRAFDFAAKEAERMKSADITTEHLLLGILNEQKSLPAKILFEQGLTVESARPLISSELRDVRGAMRQELTAAAGGGAVAHARPRVPFIEFRVEGGDAILGTIYGGYVPQPGHEIVAGEFRARVTRVVHYYEEVPLVGGLERDRIAVYVEPVK